MSVNTTLILARCGPEVSQWQRRSGNGGEHGAVPCEMGA